MNSGHRYVVGDIHGCFKAFMDILRQIKFNEEDTLYVIGDMIDRGPASLKVIQYIKDHENMIPIMGNHERMMLAYIDMTEEYRDWFYNGSGEMRLWLDERIEDEKRFTVAQYIMTGKARRVEFMSDAKELVDWVRKLPYFIELDDYLLVHAGWNQLYVDKHLDECMERFSSMADFSNYKGMNYDMVWSREEFYEADTTKFTEHLCGKPKKVIFGHTPTLFMLDKQEWEAEDCKIMYWDDKIDIDCGCVYGGRLACLDLDTGKEYYAVEIEEEPE